jgi:tyrosine-protein kinase Etk/Wzc
MEENLEKYRYPVQGEQEENDNPLGEIDFTKILSILNKNLPWIVLFLVVSVSVAWLYLRYTKPLYESSSVLKLEVKSDASILGLGGVGDNMEEQYGNITGEIELIKSRLVYNKVLDQMDLDVSYFAKGDILSTEMYKNAPFKVEYTVKNDVFYNLPVEVIILDEKQYKLKYVLGGEVVSETIGLGKTIENELIRLKVSLTDNYSADVNDKPYTFIINSRSALLDYISTNLNVQVVNLNAHTIKISFTDYNKSRAQDIVNNFNDVYLALTLEHKNKAHEQTLKFLDDQLDETANELKNSETEVENFVLDAKTINVKSQIGKTVEEIEGLMKSRLEVGIQISLLDDLSNLIEADSEVEQFIPSLRLIDDPLLYESINTLNKAQTERKLLLTSTKANTGAYRRQQAEMSQIREGTLELINENKKLLNVRLDNISNSIKKLERSFTTLPGKDTKLTRIKRFYDLNEKFYLLLIDKKVQFGIAKAATVPEFQILSPASMPGAPVSPQQMLIYGIAMGVGLFMGIGLVAAKYMLHDTFTSQKELEKATIAPVLGVVPKYIREKLSVAKLVVDRNPKASVSEALRSIRTNLEFIASTEGKKVVSVTSTVGGEGKTFITVNLAGILALTNKKVIILDLDMRKPKVNSSFDVENVKGMSTLLIGKHKLEECIHKTTIDNLDFICAGPLPPNPSELILRQAMDDLLAELHKTYDLIVIDSPPVGLVTDGIIIMKKADIPIYVVRSEYSKKNYAKNINKLVRTHGFNKLSVILNGLDNFASYGYGYGYGYEYYTDDYKPQGLDASWIKSLFGKK